MIGFYILASLVILQGLVALLEGVRYLRFVRQQIHEPPGDYAPKVAVLAPCKGIDPGFQETIRALLEQEYPDYEVIFVTESHRDPAYEVIARILSERTHPRARLIEAGPAEGRGQKVHNLLRALEEVSDDVRVFAFVDSDATPSRSWLRRLVAPLADPTVGAATGYRWYVPAKGNFCSLWRSLWNASIATALGPHRRNFTWGGSTAIRRETFDAAGVAQMWRGACTEDYPLSRAVKDRGLTVAFVPQCLIPSRGRCRLGELLRFTTRQMLITRVYSPRLWQLAWVTNGMFFVAFYGGLGLALARAWAGRHLGWLPLWLALIYVPGVFKSVLRQKAVEMLLSDDRATLKRYRLAYWCLYPLANLLYVYNLIASAASRRTWWRGIHYELLSPHETVIVRRTEHGPL